jgi:hypothetical protein
MHAGRGLRQRNYLSIKVEAADSAEPMVEYLKQYCAQFDSEKQVTAQVMDAQVRLNYYWGG